MRIHTAALIVLALAGCQSTPERIIVPQIVKVPVHEYVPVPKELTRRCVSKPLDSRTVEAVVQAANARKVCEDRLNGQMDKIEKLGEAP